MRTARLLSILLVSALSCADGKRSPVDAASDADFGVAGPDSTERPPEDGTRGLSDVGPDSVVAPVPECETGYEPSPDSRCGTVPEEYRHGCGCTDGVPVAVCVGGKWSCANGLEPRTHCSACGGPPPPPDAN